MRKPVILAKGKAKGKAKAKGKPKPKAEEKKEPLRCLKDCSKEMCEALLSLRRCCWRAPGLLLPLLAPVRHHQGSQRGGQRGDPEVTLNGISSI